VQYLTCLLSLRQTFLFDCVVGRLLYRLPLCEALIAVIVVTAGFACWTLFHLQKKSVSFIQPTYIVTEAAGHSIKLWNATSKLMTCQLHGRLGNMMFAYASLVGIAQKSGRTPVLPENHFLRSLFHIRAANLPHRFSGVTKLSELRAGAYDDQFEQLQSDKQLIELIGYFQSFKYFVNIEHEIRAEFTFQQRVAAAVDKFLHNTIEENFGPDVHRRDVILIGIHVRATDMISDANIDRGYSVATPDYFTAAMGWFQHRFPHGQLLYILATDDRKWCSYYFPYKSSGKFPVVHTAVGPDVQDLAILSVCNHTIMTVGSFGWWAAWLSNGITIYYHNFPRVNSSLALEYILNDYYPDKWIAM